MNWGSWVVLDAWLQVGTGTGNPSWDPKPKGVKTGHGREERASQQGTQDGDPRDHDLALPSSQAACPVPNERW